jgi:segregation and condensation protein B
MMEHPGPCMRIAMAEDKDVENKASLEDLGRSFEAIMDQTAWDVDAPATSEREGPPVASDKEAAPTPSPEKIIEALLFLGGPPLTAARAGEIIRGLTPPQFHDTLAHLNRLYRRQGRPYAILPQGQGHVLTLRPRFMSIVEKIYGGVREARLSTAALDVLSLVAYRQPATKQEIDSLRGAESGHLLRQLVRRGLVAVTQRGDADRKEVSYGTTQRFLELFALRSLDDLPRTQDLQQI